MGASAKKEGRLVFFALITLFGFPFSALASDDGAAACEESIASQPVVFGELLVSDSSMIIWQNNIRSPNQLRLGRLLSESEMTKFATDSLVTSEEIMSNGELLKSEIVIENEGVIRDHVIHKYFPNEALLCSVVLF